MLLVERLGPGVVQGRHAAPAVGRLVVPDLFLQLEHFRLHLGELGKVVGVVKVLDRADLPPDRVELPGQVVCRAQALGADPHEAKGHLGEPAGIARPGNVHPDLVVFKGGLDVVERVLQPCDLAAHHRPFPSGRVRV